MTIEKVEKAVSSQRRESSRSTSALFVAAYIYFFGTWQNGLVTVGQSTSSINSSLREVGLFALALGVVTMLVLRDFTGFKRLLGENRLIVAYGGLALLSCLWSVVPAQSIALAFQLGAAITCGLAAAAQLDTERHIRVLAVAMLFIGLASAVYCLLVPGKGLMQVEDGYPGAWRGMFLHKSYLGRDMAMGAICGLFGILQRRYVPSSVVLLLLSITLIILARSTAPLLFVVASFAAIPALRLLQKYRYGFRVLCAVAVLFVSIGILWELNRGTVLPAIHELTKTGADTLGKSLSITGRDIIWRACVATAMERPLLGYGFAGVWTSSGPAGWIRDAANWRVTWSENSYIELWLQLGLTGLVLFSLVLFQFLMRSYIYMLKVKSWAALWPFICFALITVTSVTESILARPVEGAWVILVIWGCNLRVSNNSLAADTA